MKQQSILKGLMVYKVAQNRHAVSLNTFPYLVFKGISPAHLHRLQESFGSQSSPFAPANVGPEVTELIPILLACN